MTALVWLRLILTVETWYRDRLLRNCMHVRVPGGRLVNLWVMSTLRA